MDNIMYKSDNIIPWDTQSAFKMTSYNGQSEEHLIFCYLKGYVNLRNLRICTYTFIEKPSGNNNLTLTLLFGNNIMSITYGFDGISFLSANGKELSSDCINMNVFCADDEQGFYWCGEITVYESLLSQEFGYSLDDGNTFGLNLVQNFEDGDIGVLFGNAEDINFDASKSAGSFMILNY